MRLKSLMWFLLAGGLVLIDQVTKYLVVERIDRGESVTVISGFFHLTHIRNKGASFGMFQNNNLFFIFLISIISIAVAVAIWKVRFPFLRLSLSVILGGALGNLIDRIGRGSVVDFLDFNFGSYHFYIFNVADCLIIVGTAAMALQLLLMNSSEKVEEEGPSREK